MCRLENQDQEAPNIFCDILWLSSGVGKWAVGNGRRRTKIASWMDVISAWLSSFQSKREGYTEMGCFFLAGREDAEGEFAGSEFVNGEYVE
jgi:hypothetical protein